MQLSIIETAENDVAPNRGVPLRELKSLLEQSRYRMENMYAQQLNHDADPEPHKPAHICTPLNCMLPDCWCPRKHSPIDTHLTPQMVMFAFDGFTEDLVRKITEELFEGKFNPNGCPVTASFLMDQQLERHHVLQDLAENGYSISTHISSFSLNSEEGVKIYAEDSLGNHRLRNTFSYYYIMYMIK